MSEIVFRCDHHHVLETDGRYQVRASETGYSCGYYGTKQEAQKRAVALSKRRTTHDKAHKS